MNAVIREARRNYHKRLLENGVLTIDANGVPSNADKSNGLSVSVAKGLIDSLEFDFQAQVKAQGQTSGANFEQINMQFIQETFPLLHNLRPGKWHIEKLGNRNPVKASSFAQYEHLEYLARLTKADAKLAASLGNDYMVAPDVVVYRETEPDEVINAELPIVDDETCNHADLRAKNGGLPILHASISAKWTIRSDRAQKSRTEALGLVRNRKGRLPHIVVVTGEPLPSRLASIAMGTGDSDCVSHFALPELVDVIDRLGAEDAKELLKILIEGKRLKDISDLPLDLAV